MVQITKKPIIHLVLFRSGIICSIAVWRRQAAEKEKKMKMSITICSVIVLFSSGYARAGTWTTLDYPGAKITEAYDISGSNVVGWYMDRLGIHGFLYDGTTWTTLNYPGASVTIINSISGSSIVGVYQNSHGGSHGFLYDGTT